MAQAVRPVARDFKVDYGIVADLFDALGIKPDIAQQSAKFLRRFGYRNIFFQPV
jgi:hypothetical protein